MEGRARDGAVLDYHPVVDDAPLQIVLYPHPVLGEVAAEVPVVDESVRGLAARMIEAMYEADGVGLAAPQVGHALRMFVADARESEEPDPVVFINPELEISGQMEIAEECDIGVRVGPSTGGREDHRDRSRRRAVHDRERRISGGSGSTSSIISKARVTDRMSPARSSRPPTER